MVIHKIRTYCDFENKPIKLEIYVIFIELFTSARKTFLVKL
jgi:hypothetical protein